MLTFTLLKGSPYKLIEIWFVLFDKLFFNLVYAPYMCTFIYLLICLFICVVISFEQFLLFFESSGLIEVSFHERNKGKV